ncbi:MAG: methyltransferase domain-containing protein [Deltaproteobacteria bacterium]|nr:methyltransferase domain-containing protein [Deltaproteobacteria bacterium]
MNELFDREVAEGYDRWYGTKEGARYDLSEKELILRLLRPQGEKMLLDVGCGTGNLLLFLQRQGMRVVGVDPSPYMLEKARKKLDKGPPLLHARAEELPFKDKSFDMLILVTTLEFVEDPFLTLKEAFRVTRERVFLGVLNALSPLSIFRRIRGKFRQSIYNHARFYSLWELKALIRASLTSPPYRLRWAGLSPFPLNPFSAFLGVVIDLKRSSHQHILTSPMPR